MGGGERCPGLQWHPQHHVALVVLALRLQAEPWALCPEELRKTILPTVRGRKALDARRAWRSTRQTTDVAVTGKT